MSQDILDKAKSWTQHPFDEETQERTKALINQGSDELTDAFYTDLSFGTGGLRGIMGVGTNRMNKYTVGFATQGLANYLKKSFSNDGIKVAIAHDSRNNSPFFAKTAAEILSANGIDVFLFDGLRPTPELSFAIRHLGCQSGIVITASHNPKEYNGYKVYWEDGGQLVPPHDKNVIGEVKSLSSVSDINFIANENLIHSIGKKIDDAYLSNLLQLTNSKAIDLSTCIVYTPIHGTGVVSIPEVLKRAGYTNVHVVEEQAEPNGNFPTVVSPNPEEKEALSLALEKGATLNADLILGTDPDTDRVGIAVRDHHNEIRLLNGNQTGAVLFYYVLSKLKDNPTDLPPFVAKTIVTSDLIKDIGDHFGVSVYQTLTGFKYIAELIREKEGKEKFVCGGEESYGYLVGDDVRDKDAVAASLLLCETVAWAKAQGKSFFELLLDIYITVGFYREALVSLTKKGKKGLEEIAEMMEQFRNHPPSTLGGIDVAAVSDYQAGVRKDLLTSKTSAIDLPSSNVIQFHLSDGSLVTARPSGTEPKIKFYFSVKGELASREAFDESWSALGKKIDQFKADLIP